MSRAISFGCKPTDEIYLKHVLPALLNKTKVQTIRPAWKECDCDKDRLKVCSPSGIHEKEAGHKPGDECNLFWKMRGGKEWFYTDTGMEAKSIDEVKNMFHKHLGRVRITKVYKIEMHGDGPIIYKDGKVMLWEDHNALSKRDGFPDIITMRNWFHKNYSLDTPKQFWVKEFSYVE